MRIDPAQHQRIMDMTVQPQKDVTEKQGLQKGVNEMAKVAGKPSQSQQLNPEDAGSKVDIFA
jgi:hypothetical protein